MAERIFISHASEDEAVVERIVAYLEAHGVPCWIASRDIPPRSIYAEEITQGIKECSACAVIVSEAANVSDAVKRELELASHYRKPFIPIRIDATEPGPGLAYYLQNTQWLDYRRDGEQALDRITTAKAALRPSTPSQARQITKGAIVAGAVAVVAIGSWFALTQSTPARREKAPIAPQQTVSAAGTTPSATTKAPTSPSHEPNPSRTASGPVRQFPNGANSDRFCELLDRIAQQAPQGFAHWKSGEPQIQDDGSIAYEASERLPGASHCTVITPQTWSIPSYGCIWDTESHGQAEQAATQLVAAIRTCPNIIRGIRGRPAIGSVQFEVRTLGAPNDNVVSLSGADMTGLVSEAERVRRAAPHFPNDTFVPNFCEVILRVATETSAGLVTWKREPPRISDSGSVWLSSYRIPGAVSCSIVHAKSNQAPAFGCHWNTPSQSIAAREVEMLANSVRSCPGAERGYGGDPRLGGVTFTIQTLRGHPTDVHLSAWKPPE